MKLGIGAPVLCRCRCCCSGVACWVLLLLGDALRYLQQHAPEQHLLCAATRRRQGGGQLWGCCHAAGWVWWWLERDSRPQHACCGGSGGVCLVWGALVRLLGDIQCGGGPWPWCPSPHPLCGATQRFTASHLSFTPTKSTASLFTRLQNTITKTKDNKVRIPAANFLLSAAAVSEFGPSSRPLALLATRCSASVSV